MPPSLDKAVADILALHAAGQARRALDSVNALLPRHLEVPGLYNIRGGLHASLGATGAAHKDRRRAVILWPGFHQAYFNLGNMAGASGRPHEALLLQHRAATIEPGFAPALNSRGALLRGLGRWREACGCFLEAARRDPGHAEAIHNLANICRDLGDYPAAATAYRKLLALAPAHQTGWRHLGITAQESTAEGAARTYHRRALAISPDDAEAHRQLANLIRYAPDEPHLAVLRARLRDAERALEDSARLHFALAKAHDDFSDLDGAFAHYRHGNAARKKTLGYDFEQHRDLAAIIKQAFSGAAIELPAGSAIGVRPIFIVGMPRSGTTLIEQVLASHPEVHGAGELNDLTRLAYHHLPGRNGGAPGGYARDDLVAIRDGYLAEAKLLAAGKPVLVDKMPTNFLWLGVIRSALPEARIVNLRRDPRAVAWSLYRHYFPATAHGYAYDLGDIARFVELYRDLMNFWSERFPGGYFDLDYDAFTRDPEAGARVLLEFCGLAWDPCCLDFHRSTRPIKTASAGQVRQGIYQGSSESWRRYQRHILAALDGADPLGFGDQAGGANSRS